MLAEAQSLHGLWKACGASEQSGGGRHAENRVSRARRWEAIRDVMHNGRGLPCYYSNPQAIYAGKCHLLPAHDPCLASIIHQRATAAGVQVIRSAPQRGPSASVSSSGPACQLSLLLPASTREHARFCTHTTVLRPCTRLFPVPRPPTATSSTGDR